MIAAIYARKSTDQTGIDESMRSVTRQIEHAKAYAARKGWEVREQYVFVDDGVSGAEFERRDGLNALKATLGRKAPFDVLIISEDSRLGRESIDTAKVVRSVIEAGARIFAYLDDREITLGSAMDKLMLSIRSFQDEAEREQAVKRTHDALKRKAGKGHVTGGRVYGYENFRRADGVVRVINAEQAAIVRRIFERYAVGQGITRIAKALNADGIAPPRARQLGWAPTAVREILYRDLYRGTIVWNKLQKIVRKGTKTRRVRPESEWLRIDAPELRIIDESLWARVRERLDANQESYARVAGGRLRARPARVDLDSKYLLTGFLVCAECGGSVTASPRTVKGGAVLPFYRCTHNWKRGHTVCAHNSIVAVDPLHTETQDALAKVLDERVVNRAFARALDRFRQDQGSIGERRAVLDREISEIQTRERNLARAIAALPPESAPDALLSELQAEQGRRRTLEGQRSELEGAEQFAAATQETLAHDIREALADVAALLAGSVPKARQALRWLGARFTLKPVTLPDGRRGVEFTGAGSYSTLFSRVLAFPGRGKASGGHRALSLVSPTGFEPVFPD